MTSQARIEPGLARLMQGARQIDSTLPDWARRSNPIVRRQLGVYWKTLPLELTLWLRILGAQAAVMLLAIPIPVLYSVIMPVVTVSVIIIPLVFVLYGQVLYGVMIGALTSIIKEKENNTLALLRVTPLPFSHILFSKVAAGVWRQMDNLGLVVAGHGLLSLPLIVLQFAPAFRAREDNVMLSLLIILGLFGYLARLLLEPVMLGALGALCGAIVAPRILAVIVGAVISGTYFLFINLPRLVPMPLGARVLVEFGLPLVLPVLITWLALVGASYALRRD